MKKVLIIVLMLSASASMFGAGEGLGAVYPADPSIYSQPYVTSPEAQTAEHHYDASDVAAKLKSVAKDTAGSRIGQALAEHPWAKGADAPVSGADSRESKYSRDAWTSFDIL